MDSPDLVQHGKFIREIAGTGTDQLGDQGRLSGECHSGQDNRMVIPSNDAVIGNDNPTAFSMFDGAGVFQGPLVIEVTGQNIYDAGTEANDGQGAAFFATGGMATDEALPIALHMGLANFIGTETANMETILSAFASSTPIARITITESIPEPSSALLLCGIALPLWGMVRRRTHR